MTVICDVCGEELKDTRGLFGHKRLKHPELGSDNGKPEGKIIITRPQPLDAVIQDLVLPSVPEHYDGTYNIYIEGFNAGVMHGAKSILAGIRAAQELSAIGVQQATPVIRMAQEMRHAEGQAAQELAVQMGQSMAQGNSAIIDAINHLPKGQPEVNPMFEVMKPFLARMMEQVSTVAFKMMPQLGMSLKGATPPGQMPSEPPNTEPASTGQSDAFGELPGNIKKYSLNELEKEAEGND